MPPKRLSERKQGHSVLIHLEDQVKKHGKKPHFINTQKR